MTSRPFTPTEQELADILTGEQTQFCRPVRLPGRPDRAQEFHDPRIIRKESNDMFDVTLNIVMAYEENRQPFCVMRKQISLPFAPYPGLECLDAPFKIIRVRWTGNTFTCLVAEMWFRKEEWSNDLRHKLEQDGWKAITSEE